MYLLVPLYDFRLSVIDVMFPDKPAPDILHPKVESILHQNKRKTNTNRTKWKKCRIYSSKGKNNTYHSFVKPVMGILDFV